MKRFERQEGKNRVHSGTITALIYCYFNLLSLLEVLVGQYKSSMRCLLLSLFVDTVQLQIRTKNYWKNE